MKIRGVTVGKSTDYSEHSMIQGLREREDRIQQIKESMPRGTKAYMNQRQRDYKRVKRGA